MFCAYGTEEQRADTGNKEFGSNVKFNMDENKNKIIHEALVGRENIVFPPLHIEPGLMKQFVKVFDTENDVFQILVAISPVKLVKS